MKTALLSYRPSYWCSKIRLLGINSIVNSQKKKYVCFTTLLSILAVISTCSPHFNNKQCSSLADTVCPRPPLTLTFDRLTLKLVLVAVLAKTLWGGGASAE